MLHPGQAALGLFTVRKVCGVDTEQLQGILHQRIIHQKPRPERVQDGGEMRLQSRFLSWKQGRR